MTIRIILILLVCFISSSCFGQVDTTARIKRGKHKVFIKQIENETGKRKIKGYPIAVNDSGIWITKGLYPKPNRSGELRYTLIFIEANNISRMYFRRKGSIGWGIIAGSIAGMFIGGAIASASIEQPEKPFAGLEVFAGVIVGLEGGSILGGLTGSQIRKRINIGGDLQNFLNAKDNMIRYLPSHTNH